MLLESNTCDTCMRCTGCGCALAVARAYLGGDQ
jgi:hypothetical protein